MYNFDLDQMVIKHEEIDDELLSRLIFDEVFTFHPPYTPPPMSVQHEVDDLSIRSQEEESSGEVDDEETTVCADEEEVEDPAPALEEYGVAEGALPVDPSGRIIFASAPKEGEKAEPRAKHWCFTYNNYTAEGVQRLRDAYKSGSNQISYLIFGREVGSKEGTPHLQGFVSFHSRLRRSQVTRILGQMHLEVTRLLQPYIKYCKKDGDFEEFGSPPRGQGSRSDLAKFKDDVKKGILNLKLLRELHSGFYARHPRFCLEYVQDHQPVPQPKPNPLRPWQQTLYHDLILPPDDRKIIFVVDYVGNTGKSWFAHYYCSLHPDNSQVLLPGKKADMSFALRVDIRVLFLDCPRFKQGEYIQYDFLEDVKNGYVFSNKYESRIKTLERIHIVVNMNESPDMTKLSMDRFDIRNLN